MTTPRVTIQKAALWSIFVGVRKTITDLRDELYGWHGWPTAESDAERVKKTFYLAHLEEVLSSLEKASTTKRKERARKGRKQQTRLQLVICPECLYKARIANSWLDIGVPKCPNSDCGMFDKEMSVEEPLMIEETTVEETMREFSETSETTDTETLTPEEVDFFEKAGRL